MKGSLFPLGRPLGELEDRPKGRPPAKLAALPAARRAECPRLAASAPGAIPSWAGPAQVSTRVPLHPELHGAESKHHSAGGWALHRHGSPAGQDAWVPGEPGWGKAGALS